MDDLKVSSRLTIPGTELSLAFARSGGPGGQNVNKVASKAEVRWSVRDSRALDDVTRAYLLGRLASRLTTDGELIVTSTLTRDQGKNRADALAKLAAVVARGLERPRPRRATKPTRSSVRRRLDSKKKQSEKKRTRRVDD